MGKFNLLQNLTAIIYTIVQSLCFVKLCGKTLMERKVGQLNKTIYIVTFTLFNCLSFTYLYQFNKFLPRILFIASCMIFVYMLHSSRLAKNVMEPIALNIITSFTYYITLWFTTYITAYFFNTLNESVKLPNFVLDFVSTAVALAIVYMLVSKLMPRYMNYKDNKVTKEQFCLLMVFCLTGFISLMLYQHIFSIIIGAICNIAILMFSSDINTINQKDKHEKLLMERNAMLEKQDKILKSAEEEKYKSYRRSVEAEEKIRKINHDLNHHFNYILSCDKDVDKIRKYIHDLKGDVNEISKYYDTGSSVVDLILEEQYRVAEKAGVAFKVMGDFEGGLKIEPAIASLIFGNLLNNAVEAASKLPKDMYRMINTEFFQDPEDGFCLRMINSADVENIHIVNGLIETSKEDKDSHGIGLASVREAVKSCGGRMRIWTMRDTFHVEIRIPIE